MALHNAHSAPSPVSKSRHSKPLTNGEVVEILKSFPENRPFGTLDDEPEFLRQLYLPLHNVFKTTTTTSRANRTRIQKINRLEVLQSLYCRFSQFEKDPLEFWERLIEALPQYSDQILAERARAFLQGAVQLDSKISEQRIFQRFVAVAAYNLFRRAIPTSETRILSKSVKEFLHHMGLPNSDGEISKYGDIIRRGQKHTLFCQKLRSGTIIDDGDHDRHGGCVDQDEDYGPLFFLSIPDSM